MNKLIFTMLREYIKMFPMFNIDSIDEQLIKLLEKDALQSSKAIAQELNISSATVRRKTKKLIQNDVIRIIGVVNRKKVGYPACAVIAFEVATRKIEFVAQSLASRPEVRFISTVTGPARCDLVMLIWFRSTDELSDFVQGELAAMEGVGRIKTFLCLRVQKDLHDTVV